MTKKGPTLHRTYEEAAQDQVSDESDWAVLVSSFAVLLEDCGPAIEEAIRDTGSVIGGLDRNRCQVACVMNDVFNICGAISGASGQNSDEIARICTIIVDTLQGRRPLAGELESQPSHAQILELLHQFHGKGTACLCIPEIVAAYDTVHKTQLITRVIDSYWRLTVAASAPFMTWALEDADIMSATAAVAKEYLAFLEKYTIDEGDSCSDSFYDNPSGNHASTAADEQCLECAEAYRLLELSFGAGADEVKQAQRELAKNLHPDVWVNRRGARAAEEQLKQVNASCDHLSRCRWSANATSKNDESKRQAKKSADKGREYYEKGRAQWSQYVENGDGSTVAGEPRLWRVAKVFLRAVWRVSKIVFAVSLAALAAAIVLFGIFMALWEYWEGQSRKEHGQSSLGSMNSRLFSFLESVTWLPRQIWGGLMLVATTLFFCVIFAGQSLATFASSNLTACEIASGLIAVIVAVWVLHREWAEEFWPYKSKASQADMSWAMGLVVVISLLTACAWLRFSNVDTTRLQVEGQTGESAVSPSPTAQSESPQASSESNQDTNVPLAPIPPDAIVPPSEVPADAVASDIQPAEAPVASPSKMNSATSTANAPQESDVVQAIRKSCESGYSDSCAHLARLYDAGDGVPHDMQQAALLYRKACDLGAWEGCSRLSATGH